MREKIKTCFLFLLVSVICFFILEFAYRCFLFGIDGLSIKKVNSTHSIGLSGMLKPSADPEVIYELKPNLDTFFKLVRFKTNAYGLRDKAYTFKKLESVFRIAVVGDSYTMPSGIEIEDAFHTLLEERLNREQKKISYEVINFGVGGYQLRQYLGVIKHKASKYDPDMILIGFCARNDYKVIADDRFKTPFVIKERTTPGHNSLVLFKLALMWHTFRNDSSPPRNKKSNFFVNVTNEEKAYMKKNFSQIGEYCLAKKIPVVVVHLATRPFINPTAEKMITGNSLYFLDVCPEFKNKDFSDYEIYDTHPNTRANKVFSDLIYDYFIENQLLPAHG